jgi:DNA invertase Pin-like site-specific DNA recombinase
MTAAARREFDAVQVYKIDRFGRSVLRLSQQLAALTSYGVRFIAVSQAIDTDASNPSSRLMLTIFSGVAEFEREIIVERTRAGVRAAKARGKVLGRPRRVFRRDEVVRLRTQGMSWRAIAKALTAPVSTVIDAYRCTEMVTRKGATAAPETKQHAVVA